MIPWETILPFIFFSWLFHHTIPQGRKVPKINTYREKTQKSKLYTKIGNIFIGKCSSFEPASVQKGPWKRQYRKKRILYHNHWNLDAHMYLFLFCNSWHIYFNQNSYSWMTFISLRCQESYFSTTNHKLLPKWRTSGYMVGGDGGGGAELKPNRNHHRLVPLTFLQLSIHLYEERIRKNKTNGNKGELSSGHLLHPKHCKILFHLIFLQYWWCLWSLGWWLVERILSK